MALHLNKTESLSPMDALTRKCTVTVAIKQDNACQQCSSLSTVITSEPMQTKRIKVIIQEPIKIQ